MKCYFIENYNLLSGYIFEENENFYELKTGDAFRCKKKKDVFFSADEANKQLELKVKKYRDNIESEIENLGIYGFIQEILSNEFKNDQVLLAILKEKLKWSNE